jgi:hypothetical protein
MNSSGVSPWETGSKGLPPQKPTYAQIESRPPPAHTSCSSASALQEGCPLWAASAMLGVNDVVAKSSDENLKTTSCTPEALGEGLPWQ